MSLKMYTTQWLFGWLAGWLVVERHCVAKCYMHVTVDNKRELRQTEKADGIQKVWGKRNNNHAAH